MRGGGRWEGGRRNSGVASGGRFRHDNKVGFLERRESFSLCLRGIDGSMILVGQGEDNPPCSPQEDNAAPCEVQESLVEVQVNLPQLEKRTNGPFESALASFQAVAISRQPNHDNTLDLASLDAPEKLDTMAEQPLLAVAQPEDIRMTTTSRLPLPPITDPTPDLPMPKLDNFVHLASLNAAETMDFMAVQPLLAGNQSEVVHSAAVHQLLPSRQMNKPRTF